MTSPTSSYSTKKTNASGPATPEERECALLDALIVGFNLKNDAQLAVWLGVDKSLIYATRAGKRRLGIAQRLKILDHIGFLGMRSIAEAILPENIARRLAALNHRMVKSEIERRLQLSEQEKNSFLLDSMKSVAELQTDAELAKFLGIKHNTIATIRGGSSSLGPKPRLKILAFLDNQIDASKLFEVLDSTTLLLNIVNRWTLDSGLLCIENGPAHKNDQSAA